MNFCEIITQCGAIGLADEENVIPECEFFELKAGTKRKCKYCVKYDGCTSPKAIEMRFRYVVKCLEDGEMAIFNHGRQHVCFEEKKKPNDKGAEE